MKTIQIVVLAIGIMALLVCVLVAIRMYPVIWYLAQGTRAQRTFDEYGYWGLSPSDIRTKMEKAAFTDDIRAGFNALAVSGLHYDDSLATKRECLEILRVFHAKANNEWKAKDIECSGRLPPAYCDFERWGRVGWKKLGPIVQTEVYGTIYALFQSSKDSSFRSECSETLLSLRPDGSDPEVDRVWKYYADQADVQ